MPNSKLGQFTLTDLFKKLTYSIRRFSASVGRTASLHENESSDAEVKELIKHIMMRTSKDDAQSAENKEIIKMLNLLLKDKKVFEAMSLQSDEWIEFINAIEKRLAYNSEALEEKERKVEGEIREILDKVRSVIRE